MSVLDQTRQSLQAILWPAWSQELGGLLPLSALIDFVDVPRILHIFQLSGLIPLWCWPITPSGSRLLLAEKPSGTARETPLGCCLDQYGRGLDLTCIDGRYGDSYLTPSPTTLRLAMQNLPAAIIQNNHENMSRKDRRLQVLNFIHVSRMPYNHKLRRPLSYILVNTIGWLVFLGLLVLCVIASLWLALIFLVAIPCSGGVVYLLHGRYGPRSLSQKVSSNGSHYNRLVVAAQHMNETEWFVFYGESCVVNSLLNQPIVHHQDDGDEETGHDRLLRSGDLLRILLRGLIFLQWATAIGSAAIKGWDAYVVTFWVMSCILSHTYAFSAERGAKSWLRHYAGVKLERCRVRLSSRRALLNTVMALNPDTFAPAASRTSENKKVKVSEEDDYSQLDPSALLWIDPILRRCEDRSRWEETTRLGMEMKATSRKKESEGEESCGEKDILEDTIKGMHWGGAVLEGMEVADKITKAAELSGRYVRG